MSRKAGGSSTPKLSLATSGALRNDDYSMTEPPFHRLRGAEGLGGAPSGLLFVCDHAANAVPEGTSLGLAAGLMASHIAYDIGAAAVVRDLAARFASPAILGSWSRLVIDLNRGEDDPTLVMKLSDGSVIPGNRDAGPDEIARRIQAFHAPYHAAIAAEIAATAAAGQVPVLISIHSFTPVWKGHKRKWQVSVVSDRDRRLADPLLARLSAAGLTAGDNEPYAGGTEGATLDRHGTRTGLPHVLIEIRQDLVGDAARSAAFVARLAPILAAALADMGPPERRQKTHNS
jgi:predicted N-formylglutamate amidohydrolase